MIYTHVMDKGLNRVKSPLDDFDALRKFTEGREGARTSSNILPLSATSPA